MASKIRYIRPPDTHPDWDSDLPGPANHISCPAIRSQAYVEGYNYMLAANKYGASNYGHPANQAAFAMGMADAAGDMLLEQQDEHPL